MESWLKKLDPNDVELNCEIENLPVYIYKYSGWEIEFLAMPKTPEGRCKKGIRPIGMQSFGAKWYKTWEVICDGLTKKTINMAILESHLSLLSIY